MKTLGISTLGAALTVAALVLVGCGGSADGPVAQDPGASSPTAPSSDITASGAPELVQIVSGSATGGPNPQARLEKLLDEQQREEYVNQFTSEAFRQQLTDALATVPASRTAAAAVVMVSCDPAPDVRIDAGTLAITATKVVSPLPNCFAPVTSVAVVALD